YSSRSCSRSGSSTARKSSRISASASGTWVVVIPDIVTRSDRAGLAAGDDRHAHGAAPLRPRAVVVPDVLEAEEVLQHEPRVAGALTDAAVGDDGVAVLQSGAVAVDGLELFAGLEAAVLGDRLAPGHALRGRDVAGPQRALLRVGGCGGALTAVLLRRADIDEWPLAEVLEDVVPVGAQDGVVTLDDRIVSLLGGRDLCRQLAALGDPEVATAVEQAHVLVAEKGENPQGVGRPP